LQHGRHLQDRRRPPKTMQPVLSRIVIAPRGAHPSAIAGKELRDRDLPLLL
jgi:hypothetical protein